MYAVSCDSLPFNAVLISISLSPEAKKKLFAHPPDVILFTSGFAVKGLAENLEKEDMKRLADEATVMSIGPVTSGTIRSYGVEVGIESKKQTIADIINELLIRHGTNTLIHRK